VSDIEAEDRPDLREAFSAQVLQAAEHMIGERTGLPGNEIERWQDALISKDGTSTHWTCMSTLISPSAKDCKQCLERHGLPRINYTRIIMILQSDNPIRMVRS
jgi:hypothetical protein